LPGNFPTGSFTYTLTKAWTSPDGLTVFPGKYKLTVNADGTGTIDTPDRAPTQLKISAAEPGRLLVSGAGGAMTFGNFAYHVDASGLVFSDLRPGLETELDRFFLAHAWQKAQPSAS